uniref:Retinol dehydrogenase 16-like n=1 Tax=Salvator merianae TaxID=96440 RepID=A0A8D0BQL0_SALMN
MWLYVALLLGFYFLRRWYRERQTVENLTEKYVFITGCDSGFGNQLARQLDARGLRVLAACFTQKGAEQLEKATSERLKTTLLDVTSTESVKAATEWVKGCVGDKGLWGLVNNAGIGVPVVPNAWLCKDDFMRILNVNFLGAVDVTLHMLPFLRRAQGRVVNVSSLAGRFAYSGGGYSPSKFALEAFSDSLRRELYPFGIKVSIVEPGAFNTGINEATANYHSTIWTELPVETKDLYGEQYWKNFPKTFVGGSWVKTDLSLVTNCMEHALTSCHPRSRYSAGWDVKLFYIPLSYLPASVGDYIVAFGRPKPTKALY